MKSGTKLKQILVSLFGNVVLGAGVAFSAQARLGTDPSVSGSQAISNYFGISLGLMVTITNIILAICVFIIYRKNLGITTLIVVFLNQYPIDFFSELIPYTDVFAIRILYVLIGSVLVAFACNIMINSNLGMGVYDAFVFSFVYRFNIKFIIVRYIVDASFLAITLLFKGYIGIGTILAYLLTGNLMNITKPYIDKIVHFE